MFKRNNNVKSEINYDQNIKKTDGNSMKRQNAPFLKLTELENGKLAKVIDLQGGQQFYKKLEAMEIIPGTVILKKSATLMKGPIVIEIGNNQFAIGYGMAQRIIVEPINNDKTNQTVSG
ncbi:MAG TPA: ferrous iron transport protein A [Clostridia bacterium]|nr:ferrous iron transport protein A [Clostridia bacterium]